MFVLSEERDRRFTEYLEDIRDKVRDNMLRSDSKSNVQGTKFYFMIDDNCNKIYLTFYRTIDKKQNIAQTYLIIQNDVYHKLNAKHYGTPKTDTRKIVLSEAAYKAMESTVNILMKNHGYNKNDSYVPGIAECMDDLDCVLKYGI